MKKFLILIVSAVFLVAFAMPAAAQSEFSFFGSTHMDTMVTDTDNPAATGLRDTSPLTWDLSTGNWSSFGANIKVDDKTSGIIEYRSGPGQAYIPIAVGGSEVKPYGWTGTYNMGFATLRIGRWWSLSFNPPPAWMVNTVGSPIVTVQEPEIRLEGIMLGPVKFQIAAERADELGITGNGVLWGVAVTEQTMPKLEARADVTFGPIGFTLMGGYYSYDIYTNATTTARSSDIDSDYWGAMATFNSGPISMRASWISYTNPNQWAGAVGNARITAAFNATDTAIIDASRDDWQAYITYTLNPTVSFNFIYGESKYEQSIGGFNNEDDQSGWAFTVPINISKNFTVRLEYGVVDNDDRYIGGVRTEETKITQYGARWIIFF